MSWLVFMGNWESKIIIIMIFAVIAFGSIAPLIRMISDSSPSWLLWYKLPCLKKLNNFYLFKTFIVFKNLKKYELIKNLEKSLDYFK